MSRATKSKSAPLAPPPLGLKLPDGPDYWWAQGHYTGAPGKWQLFVVAYKANTKVLVARFADAIHPEDERDYPNGLWFSPKPDQWKNWQRALPPSPEFPDPDLPSSPSPQGLSRLESAILEFWSRWNDDGVKRTVHFDESDREQVSRGLAAHILQNVPTMTFPEPGTVGHKTALKSFGVKFNDAMKLSEKRKAQRLAKARKK